MKDAANRQVFLKIAVTFILANEFSCQITLRMQVHDLFVEPICFFGYRKIGLSCSISDPFQAKTLKYNESSVVAAAARRGRRWSFVIFFDIINLSKSAFNDDDF